MSGSPTSIVGVWAQGVPAALSKGNDSASSGGCRCVGTLPPICRRLEGVAAVVPVPFPGPLHCIIATASVRHTDPSCRAADAADALIGLEDRWCDIQRRKANATHRYTHDAEAAADAFLKERYGFVADAIPWDYLDHPPSDLNLVRSNLNTLLHVTSDVFLPTSMVCSTLIRPFVRSVWAQWLHPLRADMMAFREALLLPGEGTTLLHLASAAREDAKGCDVTQRLQWLRTEVDKDLLYMERIYRLDADDGKGDDGKVVDVPGATTKEALSDFVSISGVVIGRLHRLENEHRTVLEHWSR